MTRKSRFLLALASFLFVSLACQVASGPGGNAPPPTEAIKAAQATKTVVKIDTTATAKTKLNQSNATRQARDQANVQGTLQAKAAQATQEAKSTATARASATAQAESMTHEVAQLQSEGIIEQTSGRYYALDDFKESWAQLGWYQWWSTGYSPANFVIRAHTAWESASKTADWYNAGCGFVFRARDENNHYMIYLALDGNVYMKGYVKNEYRELGREYYGPVKFMQGEADVVLAVDGSKITYLIDGKKVFQRDNKELAEGDLAMTLVSGTNKDFGTRCTMTQVELWDLSSP